MTESEFRQFAAQGYNRIPLVLETFADLDTPLSVYLKLANRPWSYLLESVIDYIEDPSTASEPPLDLAGTPFQQEVWRALRAVPPGETTTYAELARRIGRPSAVRAVAGAVAANPLAVLVPCHRVIRSDGSLSGYRWGVVRKRELLARERLGNRAIQRLSD